MPSRKQPVPRDSRQSLLEAASVEFANSGLRGARVHTIVKGAGVNERMLYHHFGSKEFLYRAVLEAQWNAVARAWEPELEGASSLAPREGLRRAFTALAGVLRNHPLLMRLAMHEAMNGWNFAPEATIDRVPPQLRALHLRGKREGVFRADVEFELVYLTVVGALTSRPLMSARFSRSRATRDSNLDERIVGLVMDGIEGEARPKEAK